MILLGKLWSHTFLYTTSQLTNLKIKLKIVFTVHNFNTLRKN